jgi:transglutaminase-like putative cysteine protease
VFYAVMLGEKQVGFASSTIDTSSSAIEQREYLVADMQVGGSMHRAETKTTVQLSRALRLKSFDATMNADQGPVRAQGEMLGDSVVRLALTVGRGKPDSQLIAVRGPILLPTLIPLAVALEEKPHVGKTYVLPQFDPTSRSTRDIRIDVLAESLFVVNDSSVFDSTAGRWHGVLPDTIRAWQIVSQSGSGVSGWVDEQGRLVASTQLGFRLVRMPYEVAFENWQRENAGAARTANADIGGDLLESTAIAANKQLRSSLTELRVRLSGLPLNASQFTLNGGRQTLHGDTLTVRRELSEELEARYPRFVGNFHQLRPDLRAEPFLEAENPEIVATAQRIAGAESDPLIVSRRLAQWVHDSVQKQVTIGIPSALGVLHTRVGDCNEHTQLFVALARAAGIPARVVAGMAYVDGKFYYHAWPEVLLRHWVAVDPTFGQFPADASHIRFVTGGFLQQAELVRLATDLRVDVLSAK